MKNAHLHDISEERYTWYNATSNVISNPLHFFYPRHKEDLQSIVIEASLENKRVRAVGSGHSYSEAAKCDDFLIDMKHLRDIELYHPPAIRPDVAGKFVVAEAGVTIKRLNLLLEQEGLALSNMGVIDFQTISGALMTGTHGTGINRPAIPDMVVGLRFVTADGSLLQIEPANGITDPIYHAMHQPFPLIQNDLDFFSCVLSFGAMGIAYELILEVEPLYWMRENRTLEKWSAFREEILSNRFFDQVEEHDFVAFRFNPYKIKGDYLCSVVEQDIEYVAPDKLSQAGRNILIRIFGNMASFLEGTIQLVNRIPSRAPKRVQTTLKLSKANNVVDKSYKMLYQGSAAILRYGISSEFAFPYDKNVLVNAIEQCMKLIKELSDESGIYNPSHMSVRFVPASKAYLSSAYGEPKFYLDVPTLAGTIGYQTFLERFQKMMIGLGGIPHWGKVNNMLYLDNDFIEQQYPKLNEWKGVRKKMDPDGRFLNDFVLKMGLD